MRDTGDCRKWRRMGQMFRMFAALMVCAGFLGGVGRAQENPLGQVHTQAPPPPKKTPEDSKPLIEGAANVAAHATANRNARIRVNVNLVLVPATVTDPMNRLVTGLEKENFQVFDNNTGQVIKSFSTDDASVQPLTPSFKRPTSSQSPLSDSTRTRRPSGAV